MTTEFEQANIQRTDALIREVQLLTARIEVIQGHTRGMYAAVVVFLGLFLLGVALSVLGALR